MFLFILLNEYDIKGVMHVYCMICVTCGHNSRRIPRTSTDFPGGYTCRVTSRVGVMSTIFVNKSLVIRQSAFLMSKRNKNVSPIAVISQSGVCRSVIKIHKERSRWWLCDATVWRMNKRDFVSISSDVCFVNKWRPMTSADIPSSQ